MFNSDNVRDAIAIILTVAFAIMMCWKGVLPQEFMDVYMIVLGFFFAVPRNGSTTITTPPTASTTTSITTENPTKVSPV